MASYDEITLTDFEEYEKALCEASLFDFTRVFWSEVEGQPFQSNWHIEAICDHLQALSNLDIRKLVINGPPRSGKSRPASIMWQPWDWIKNPHYNWITSALALELAIEFNYFSRVVIRSEKYQRYWGHKFQIVEGNDLKKQYLNNLGAKRLAVSIGSKFIGFGGTRKIIDDPHMPDDTPEQMDDVWKWFTQTWRPRTSLPKEAVELLNMQVLSDYDLTHRIKHHEKDLWEFLILPSRYDPSKRYWTSLGWTDPRTQEGELLFPSLMGDREEAELRRSLGSKASAQMDQSPLNEEDSLYKDEFLGNFYDKLIYDPETDIVVTTTDCGVKGKTTSDFTASMVGIKKGSRFFHVEGFIDKFEFGPLHKAYVGLLSKWTKLGVKFYKHLIEDAALGPALFNTTQKKFSRAELVKAVKNKIVRLKSVVPVYESNRVWYPAPGAVIIIDGVEHPLDTSWVQEWIKQTREAPFGKNDDGPDATAQWITAVEDLNFEEAEYEDDDYEVESDKFVRLSIDTSQIGWSSFPNSRLGLRRRL